MLCVRYRVIFVTAWNQNEKKKSHSDLKTEFLLSAVLSVLFDIRTTNS